MNSILNSLKINLLHAGYTKLDNNWHYENVISPFSRIVYVTKGSAVIHHTNQTFYLKPGHMYLIPSYIYNRYQCEIYHKQYYVSFFDEIKYGLSLYNFKNFIYEVEANEFDIDYFKRLVEINPNMGIKDSNPKTFVNRSYMKKIHGKEKNLITNYYIETKGIISILLSRFIKNSSHPHKQKSIEGDLNKVIIYIAQNLHTSISIEKLAAYCSLNTDYFSRAFKEKFEIRPHKYIQQKRIERAQLLLLTTYYSLKKIANEVGFKDVSHFSKTFKVHTNESPSRYRKEHLSV
tara:strand:+ start:198 stop:1067 length:870 start_codon:yes stop_codon:yes gene_type:complete